MPDLPPSKPRPHPWKNPATETSSPVLSPAPGAVPYCDLHVTTNYTFLTGGSHPDEFVRQAATLGHRAAAITDRNTLAGIVRAHVAAKEVGIPLVVGCRVELNAAGRYDNVTHRAASSPPLSFLLFPTSRAAYARLCRLLTLGKRRASKGDCFLTLHDVLAHQAGLLAVAIPPAILGEDFIEVLAGLGRVFDDDRLSLAASRLYGEDDHARLAQLAALSSHIDLPLVATNDVHYHTASRRALQDVLTCIRLGCTLDQAGFALHANAERHMKAPGEMARVFAAYPQAIERTVAIAQRATRFNLDELRYQYPDEVCPSGMTAMQHLKELTWKGAAERYGEGEARAEPARREGEVPPEPRTREAPPEGPEEAKPARRMVEDERATLARVLSAQALKAGPSQSNGSGGTSPSRHSPFGIPPAVRAQIEHEFALIEELDYAKYFLTVHDIVVYARSLGILCQGRGAAANSAVCYCLGITAVDPDRIDLLFERFVSKERKEPPDIDIDFEHERREEVIQYLYAKYGRDRAALVAEVISYRGRSAVRDVGKALGLSLDCVDRLAKNMDWWDHGIVHDDRIRELGLDPRDPTILRLIALANEVLGFPRHLSQHVGGFVITQGPLCEMVPIENAAMEDRTIIEWDKDDVDAMGMLKVDCLGLGMLTCISKCFSMINSRGGKGLREDAIDLPSVPSSLPLVPQSPYPLVPSALQLHTVPPEDPAVYDMICNADTVGVFQIESRAQMTMLPRLRPRCFYDLVIEVAIVRPGPIQGDMVHPYLRRRNGEEAVTYPKEEVRKVLGRTLGVPLFQEQAMSLAIVAAGFTPGEADQLRRAIAAWKSKQKIIFTFGQKLIDGMTANGYEREFAERCFNQIKGFSEYGFPESHAASFALLVYVSAWLKRHHPAAFAAALINSQPMGFYAPAQIVRDAQQHGVIVRGVDVNHSTWDCRLEGEEEGTKGLREGGTEGEGGIGVATSSVFPFLPSSLRLGFRLVRGLRQSETDRIAAAVRAHGPFDSIAKLWRASGVKVSTLRALAGADAFASMSLDRQRALWMVRGLRDKVLPLFEGKEEGTKGGTEKGTRGKTEEAAAPIPPSPSVPYSLCPSVPSPSLPSIPLPRQVVHDYSTVGLSLKSHPIAFIRDKLRQRHVTMSGELSDEAKWPNGAPIAVAGLVLIRQRPGTASGVVFITLEDESGIANLIVRPRVFERCRRAARHATVALAIGRVERQGQVVHVMTHHIEDVSRWVTDLLVASRDFH
jgi:error-prone DNA polymerase